MLPAQSEPLFHFLSFQTKYLVINVLGRGGAFFWKNKNQRGIVFTEKLRPRGRVFFLATGYSRKYGTLPINKDRSPMGWKQTSINIRTILYKLHHVHIHVFILKYVKKNHFFVKNIIKVLEINICVHVNYILVVELKYLVKNTHEPQM